MNISHSCYARSMALTTSIEAGSTTRHTGVFETYTHFKSLPSSLLRPPRDEKTGRRPKPRAFALSLGVEDDEFLDLISLQSQKNFAVRYGVTPQTLSRWNKQIRASASFGDLNGWAYPLMANVLFRLYEQIYTGKGHPSHFKLWFELAGLNWKQEAPQRTISAVEVNVVDPVAGTASVQ